MKNDININDNNGNIRINSNFKETYKNKQLQEKYHNNNKHFLTFLLLAK